MVSIELASVSGRTSNGTARDKALVLTQSWGPFVGCCTSTWFPCVADERLHARGPTGHLGSTSTRATFRMPW
jgi:hypothetical protein